MNYRILAICATLQAAFIGWAAASTAHKVAGVPLDRYTIVYQASSDTDEGVVPATELSTRLADATGITLPVKSSAECVKGPAIYVTNPQNGGTFDYSVNVGRKKVSIEGGCNWALDRAAGIFADEIVKKNDVKNFSASGSVAGEYLFPRTDGATLRILDDNIWDYSKDTVPEVWRKAGIDCRDAARAPEFAQLVRAYMPDVLTLQEYSRHMDDEFFPLIEKYGYVNATKGDKTAWNNTPVFYNRDSLELVKAHYNLFMPSKWSNKGSKSFTSAVLRNKKSGKTFAVICTHLWWKGDAKQPGSTQARASQTRLIMAEAEVLKAKYDCPVFVVGDMNCEENTIPIRQFIEEGYVPCYKAATVKTNLDNGHHNCAPATVGSRAHHRKTADRIGGAIDHCLIYNPKGAEVKTFDCIQDYFTVKLTDHYPNLIDATL